MIFLLWIADCVSLFYLMNSLNLKKQSIVKQWILVCASQLLLSILVQRNQLLLPLFYLILYIIKFVVFQAFIQNHHHRFIVTNIIFIVVISAHLISIATFALYNQQDMSSIIHRPRFMTGGYILFLLFDIIVNIIVALKKIKITKLFSDASEEQYHNFEYFLWFCCAFLIVQSMLCQQDHFRVYISIFLICNDLLLLILVFCFIQNIYNIDEHTYVEKEHEFLQKESERRRKSMEDVKKSSDFDILTNAHSRKFTFQYMQDLKKENIPFSIIFIDLDHLKRINDFYGHSAGDQYLRSFAESVEIFLREGDILGRIGGDEFLFIMKHMDREQALERMEYIIQKIQENVHLETVYFSYGVAAFKTAGQDIESLIKEADAAMYLQKEEHKKEHFKEEKQC